MDSLVARFRNCGAGCQFGMQYIGVLTYADDIVLLCPSVRGLNRMLNVCHDFAVQHNLSFNAGKSFGIAFGCSFFT